MSLLTLVVGNQAVALPGKHTALSVHPKDRDEFVTVVRALAALPGASEPSTDSYSVLCAEVKLPDDALKVTVFLSPDMRRAAPSARPVLPGAEVLEAAVAEAVAS